MATKDQQKLFLLGVFYPAQLIAIISIFTLEPNWTALFLGWVVFCGLGSAITLHRVVAHKSIKLKPWIEKPLLVIATLCLQGSPIWWAGVHRGMHHKNADNEGDPHSPKDGLFHAYIGWINSEKVKEVSPRYITDLMRNKFHVWLYKYGNYLIWSIFVIGSIINYELMIWFWLIPAAYSYHQESIVNVFCHSGKLGYKSKKTSDNSMNLPILALFTWGQALHNNHHYSSANYNFASNDRWEFDPAVIFLPFIKAKDS